MLVPTCRVRSRSKPIADIAISTWSIIRSDSLSVFTCSHSAMSFTTPTRKDNKRYKTHTVFVQYLYTLTELLIFHHSSFKSCFGGNSPGQTRGRRLRSSSTCSCRSAPWSSVCWAPAPTCVGSSTHNLQEKRRQQQRHNEAQLETALCLTRSREIQMNQ